MYWNSIFSFTFHTNTNTHTHIHTQNYTHIRIYILTRKNTSIHLYALRINQSTSFQTINNKLCVRMKKMTTRQIHIDTRTRSIIFIQGFAHCLQHFDTIALTHTQSHSHILFWNKNKHLVYFISRFLSLSLFLISFLSLRLSVCFCS